MEELKCCKNCVDFNLCTIQTSPEGICEEWEYCPVEEEPPKSLCISVAEHIVAKVQLH